MKRGRMPDDSVIIMILKWLWAAVLAVFAWIGKGMYEDIKKHEDDLNEHKLYVAENYIKKDVIDRIHDRIDDAADDIKKILQQVGNGNK